MQMHASGSYDVYATTLVRMQRALLEACDAAGAQVSGDGARDPDHEVVANDERFGCIKLSLTCFFGIGRRDTSGLLKPLLIVDSRLACEGEERFWAIRGRIY
jgi:hypothetical protein